MFTIEDLNKGKCVVVNDGTLQELQKVLTQAFPKDKTRVAGTNKFYYSYLKNGFWSSSNNSNLPTQSVKDFIKQMRTDINLPKFGEKILVSDSGNTWVERCFVTFGENINFPVIVISNESSRAFENYLKGMAPSSAFMTVAYKLWKPLKKEVTLTFDDIRKAMNIDENTVIKIKEND